MNRSDRLGALTNVIVIVAFAVFLLGPHGVLYTRWKDWRKAVRTRETIAQLWPALVKAGERVDVGRAKPTLVEFADYQCPFCRQSDEVLNQWLVRHDVGVVYLHFPLRIHPAAEGAARAAICAAHQGRFRQMHRRLFETTAWEQDSNWTREANAAGVPDLGRFRGCLASAAVTGQIQADMALGRKLGVTGTPTFISPDQLQVGTVTPTLLSELTHSQQ